MSVDAVRYFVSQMLWLYEMLIIGYALMSWFQGLGGVALSIYGFLGTVCEPFVGLIRKVLPQQISGGAGLDLSPLAAILILVALQRLIA